MRCVIARRLPPAGRQAGMNERIARVRSAATPTAALSRRKHNRPNATPTRPCSLQGDMHGLPERIETISTRSKERAC